MSPSGRFQSRVLSQLSQQTLRWKDRAARWLRQGQVTATWSAQILLYPVYALFQTGRLIGRLMGHTVQQIRPRLQAVRRTVQTITQLEQTGSPSLTADLPIRKTLRAVEELGLDLSLGSPVATAIGEPLAQLPAAVVPSPQPPALGSEALATELSGAVPALRQASPSTISATTSATILATDQMQSASTLQGIASLLGSRNLVLVTAHNDILDILTQTQQTRLQQQMTWELAEYGRSHRQLQATAPWPLLPLPPPLARDTMVLPVREFYRLMGWVQRGPVAIAANVFEETTLALYFPSAAELELANGEMDQPWLAFADLFTESELPASGKTLADFAASECLPGEIRSDRAGRSLEETTLGETAIADAPAGAAGLDLHSNREQLDEVAIARSRIEAYIETQSTLVGYEKHPLERVLTWIDHQMLWLEKKIVYVWNWLRGLS